MGAEQDRCTQLLSLPTSSSGSLKGQELPIMFRSPDLQYLNPTRPSYSPKIHMDVSGPFSQNVDFHVSFISGELLRNLAILDMFSQLGVQHGACNILF